MPLQKGLTVTFSQVQVFEVLRERSGARGAGSTLLRSPVRCSCVMVHITSAGSPLFLAGGEDTFVLVLSVFRATKTQQLWHHGAFSV